MENGLLNSLIAYWPGNEVAGNALDLHTNALHLTDVNTVTSNPGVVYPLTRQYTTVNNERHFHLQDALLQTGDVDFTIAAWIYLDSKPAQMNVAARYGGVPAVNNEYFVRYVGGATDRLQFGVFNNAFSGYATANTYGSPPLSTWALLVCWHDSVANTINIQINNGGIDSTPYANGVLAGNFIFELGARASGSLTWDGRIGPTMFWKSAGGGGGVLTAAQRTALWNGGAGLPYAAFTT